MEDQIQYERSLVAALQKFADAVREEAKKQERDGVIDAEIEAYIGELEHLLEKL